MADEISMMFVLQPCGVCVAGIGFMIRYLISTARI